MNGTSAVIGVMGGLAIGIGGALIYIQYQKNQPVPVSLFLEKDDLRTATTGVTISLKDADGNVVIEPTTMTKSGDNWIIPNLKLRELRGNYIFTISLTSTPDATPETKDFPVTLPNQIGMTIPQGLLNDNRNIEIRWV